MAKQTTEAQMLREYIQLQKTRIKANAAALKELLPAVNATVEIKLLKVIGQMEKEAKL